MLQRYTFLIGLQGAWERMQEPAGALLSLLLVEAKGKDAGGNE